MKENFELLSTDHECLALIDLKMEWGENQVLRLMHSVEAGDFDKSGGILTHDNERYKPKYPEKDVPAWVREEAADDVYLLYDLTHERIEQAPLRYFSDREAFEKTEFRPVIGEELETLIFQLSGLSGQTKDEIKVSFFERIYITSDVCRLFARQNGLRFPKNWKPRSKSNATKAKVRKLFCRVFESPLLRDELVSSKGDFEDVMRDLFGCDFSKRCFDREWKRAGLAFSGGRIPVELRRSISDLRKVVHSIIQN